MVQLGFAGSRRLLPAELSADLQARLHGQIHEYLVNRLGQIPKDLGLSPAHFLCGLSSLAVGADTLFTRACQARDIPQRIFLPQPRDVFLNAVNSSGTPDFSPEERATAAALLDSPHVIHERVASRAEDRASRFEDVNLEIVRASDVVVCLLPADAGAKPGGTQHLLGLAHKRERPTLEIRVAHADGVLQFHETWHHLTDQYQPPQLPSELKGAPADWPGGLARLPSADEYAGALKAFASGVARGHRTLFHSAALVIILTHLLATVLAAAVLVSHPTPAARAGEPAAAGHHAPPSWVLWLLAGELLLLVTGFGVHAYLRPHHAANRWALVRLVAEITRSVRSVGKVHVHLEHLFWLPLPARLQPLLRTLDVLFMRSTRPFRTEPWQPMRDDYVSNRLLHARNGQLAYFERERPKARRRLAIGATAFVVFSLLAMAATVAKLAVSTGAAASWVPEWLPGWLGFCAIVLPVAAVAAVSYAAAMDSAARAETYKENLTFLKQQLPLLEKTESPREFAALLLETESRLLGETTNWYYRRSYTGVS